MYETQEVSRQEGMPAELYRFASDGLCWHYTSADEPIVWQGDTYYPAEIRRGELQQSDEGHSMALEIALKATLAVARPFVAGTSPTPVAVTVYRVHRTDVDLQGIVFFPGAVASSAHRQGWVTFRCVSTRQLLQRPIPRQFFQRPCNNVHYDEGCGLDPEAWKEPGTVQTINGLDVTVTSTHAGEAEYFSLGMIRIQGTTPRGMILVHTVGGVLRLLAPVPGLAVGMAVDLYPGCSRLVEACHQKYANLPNFWGFPEIPIHNPFKGLV